MKDRIRKVAGEGSCARSLRKGLVCDYLFKYCQSRLQIKMAIVHLIPVYVSFVLAARPINASLNTMGYLPGWSISIEPAMAALVPVSTEAQVAENCAC